MSLLRRILQEADGLRHSLFASNSGNLKNRIVKGAAGSFALKIGSAGLSFIVGVLLARLLGASGYGTYAYATAWVSLLSVPSVMGLDKLLVREIAVYEKLQQWGAIRRILSWSNFLALGASAAIACTASVTAWIIAGERVDTLFYSFWIAMLLLPVVSATRLRQSALRGLHRVIAGQLPEMLVQPVLLIIFLGAATFVAQKEMNAPLALWMNLGATIVSCIFGATILHRTLPGEARSAQPEPAHPEWIRSAVPLMLLSGLQILNTKVDILMLGTMVGTGETGIYSVANRGATLVTYILVAVNAALGPAVASLHASGDRQRLQRMVTKSSRIVLFFSLPVCMGLIAFGDIFLRLFGRDFVSGWTALSILSAGQLFSAMMGSVTLILVMTGHERDAVMTLGGSTLLNVLLNLLLIPRWGIEGAAYASTASTIMRNTVAAAFAYRRLGISSTALGPIGRDRAS